MRPVVISIIVFGILFLAWAWFEPGQVNTFVNWLSHLHGK